MILIFMPVQDQIHDGGGGAINMYSENPSKEFTATIPKFIKGEFNIPPFHFSHYVVK